MIELTPGKIFTAVAILVGIAIIIVLFVNYSGSLSTSMGSKSTSLKSSDSLKSEATAGTANKPSGT